MEKKGVGDQLLALSIKDPDIPRSHGSGKTIRWTTYRRPGWDAAENTAAGIIRPGQGNDGGISPRAVLIRPGQPVKGRAGKIQWIGIPIVQRIAYRGDRGQRSKMKLVDRTFKGKRTDAAA